ncbi:MAG: hypothetical protein JO235_03430 [Chroococcidiopsidaceae cyanobacterium CP_BM_RX_35]|nr:hypothetical protein [Chroococcidiopsidaceae cyanobacterium CP_BM_RX_35]
MTNPEHEPNPAVDHSGKAPTLPQFNPSFSAQKHNTDLNLSFELPSSVAACQTELQRIVQQIQSLYLEGPIVDGWLESDPSESIRPGYRLCGLDEAGNMWSHPCPPEQLPSVSIAIARYQQLLQLLKRKQQIETRLSLRGHSQGAALGGTLSELASSLVHTSIGGNS